MAIHNPLTGSALAMPYFGLRSDDTHDQASGDRRDPPKIQYKNKKEVNIQATRNRFRDLPEWLEV